MAVRALPKHLDNYGDEAVFIRTNQQNQSSTQVTYTDCMKSLVVAVEGAFRRRQPLIITVDRVTETKEINGKMRTLDHQLYSRFTGVDGMVWSSNEYAFASDVGSRLSRLLSITKITSRIEKTVVSPLQEQMTVHIDNIPYLNERRVQVFDHSDESFDEIDEDSTPSMFECIDEAMKVIQRDGEVNVRVGGIHGGLHFTDIGGNMYTIGNHTFVDLIERVAELVYDTNVRMRMSESGNGLFGHETGVSSYTFAKL